MKTHTYTPSLEMFKEKAKYNRVVPVFTDILADTDTPVSAFMKIDDGSEAFLLESVEGGEKWGRYSILGASPRISVRVKDDLVEISELGNKKFHQGDPMAIVRNLLADCQSASVKGLPRFFGGAIGYMSYDMVRQIEYIPDEAPKDIDTYDAVFIFTATVLVFDNVENKIKVVSNAYVPEGSDPEEAYRRATASIESTIKKLRETQIPVKEHAPQAAPEVSSNFTKAEFVKAVEKVKEYIADGDVIQTVISQRFSTELTVDPFDIYRALRVTNPSPYMFFLRLTDVTLVGSSPEILVRVDGKEVNVKPIAGTRKRGKNPAEDIALEKDLLSDPKEVAEHIMLVDLGRNDVGRVSEAGSVEVDDLMTVERYSHVMHIVSNVKGRLRHGLGPFDALKSCFPAGTLTGAPKIRAMEIIEELEPCKRGIYGGAVGYMGYDGKMDMCIAIRTMVIKGSRIYIQAGAGIVADSVPEKEFEETENKAKGVLKAVHMAMEGLF